MDSDATAEVLRYNPNNQTTLLVERVRTPAGNRVRKELRRPSPANQGGAAHWAASTDPEHWNYWHREAEVYADDTLRASLDGTGLDLAGAEIVDHAGGTTLWLEDVTGTAGPDFSLDDHVAAADALGRWQGRPPLTRPCSSKGSCATTPPADPGT